nr:MAG TPA: hypothetical protein [Caudoviricetes sp.]
MFWAVLTAVWGISWASGRVWLSCGCFIVWTWKWALVGLKTACLGGD